MKQLRAFALVASMGMLTSSCALSLIGAGAGAGVGAAIEPEAKPIGIGAGIGLLVGAVVWMGVCDAPLFGGAYWGGGDPPAPKPWYCQ